MPFNGTEGSAITLNEASTLTANYRAKSRDVVNAIFMGRDLLNQILAQPDCMGIRVYYAFNEVTNQPTMVFVGADAMENDMTSGIIADFGLPCPTACSINNPLNS
ncbi:MAG: hypothetical protein IT247_08930 [Bacteroidia bacterium]|nr:hypothetical protein [Bacteroidia bacterium]